jgi:phage terminase large subunit-like protein
MAKELEALSQPEKAALNHQWRDWWARPDQLAPPGDWDIWLCLAGRGWGKTRTGAEWIREEVAAGRATRIALVAETAADARDVLVEGDSGILAVYPRSERPTYEPSKRRVTWANGAIATLFNATEPDQLRGPQFDCAWCDELAKWRYARETWDQLQFGMRLGAHPRQIVTTTPRPIEVLKAMIAGQEGRIAVTRGRTMDNADNLAEPFLRKIVSRYSGTRLGRQELDAEILGDLPGALWTLANLDTFRRQQAPELGRVVVAVDPAVSNTAESDEHGIIVAGLTKQGEGVILQDGSLQGSPLDWARRALALYDKHQADAIVVEVNQGGDMVAQTLRSVRSNVNIIEVRASRGKHVRAEPIAALYEQGRVCHIGAFPDLENQMVQMTNAGYQGDGSPDRVDALVWALSELFPDLTRDVPDLSRLLRSPGGSWMS